MGLKHIGLMEIGSGVEAEQSLKDRDVSNPISSELCITSTDFSMLTIVIKAAS